MPALDTDTYDACSSAAGVNGCFGAARLESSSCQGPNDNVDEDCSKSDPVKALMGCRGRDTVPGPFRRDSDGPNQRGGHQDALIQKKM